jgi:hypothetical protein
MSYLLPLLLLVLMVSIFASLMREGMWSNSIVFINVTIAGLVATNFFEPLADFLEAKMASGTYFWDIISLWLIFAATYGVLRTMTDNVSKYAVRFRKPFDQLGGYFFAVLTAWVFLCFLTMTLHTAPLSREFFFKGFRAESPVFFGMKPDRLWLAWVQTLSRGPYDRMQTDKEREAEVYVFDPKAEFMPKYNTRRVQYSRSETFSGLPDQGT